MDRVKTSWLVLMMALWVTISVAADDKALQKRLEDLNASAADHWIYNDIAAGFEEAKRTGRPLFVTFRCVPCVDCLGFDGEVADGNETIKQLAKENFVCVRQVEMKGVDLTQFQFDHDLNWAGMFLNADGTVYARYGTQSAQGADAYNSVKGLAATMNRVLELHAVYPENKLLFKGKLPLQKKWKTPLEMPTLEPNLRNAGPTTRKNCIHCHNVHDAENGLWYEQDKMNSDRLWRYPFPENVGLVIDVRDGRTIKEVKFGDQELVGKTIDRANGQAVSSVADIQWVLHALENASGQQVKLDFVDGSSTEIVTGKNWKRSDISWRASLWTIRPRLRVWAPALEEKARKENGIADGDGALLVKWINQGKPGGRAAAKAGLRQGDIILQLDGKGIQSDNAAFNQHLKLNYEVGQTLSLTVLRGGQQMRLEIPLVE